MDKNLKTLVINKDTEVVFGNNKKFIGAKNSFTKQVAAAEYQAGIKPIVANNNTVGFTGTTGATNIVNVLTNDTFDGVTATVAKVTISVVTPNANLTLNTGTGNLSIVNPTSAGTYALTYKICQTDRPTNCSQATVTVTVT